MRTFFYACLILTASVTSGFSWGAEGHQAIAEAAIQMLTNSVAKSSVSNLLANTSITQITDIDSAATWPDDIRIGGKFPGKFAGTAAAKSFNARFVHNNLWHFVNYPLDGTYSKDGANGKFSLTNDVVQILGHCIDVLEGTATGDWAKMTKPEALSWTIHLVGDVHQPLHTAEGYYTFEGDNATLITDPAQAFGKPDDAGGNALVFGSKKFHAFWDVDMVQKISKSVSDLESILVSNVAATNFQNQGDDYRQWPATWASGSIKQAKIAYAGITIGKKDSSDATKIRITLDTKSYKNDYEPMALEQLSRAAYNLSQLLDHIKWQ